MSNQLEPTTQTGGSNRSSSSNSRIDQLRHWINHDPTFEIWLGFALMYADVIAVTMLHSWNMAWAFPIGVFFLVSGVSEKIATMVNEGEL